MNKEQRELVTKILAIKDKPISEEEDWELYCQHIRDVAEAKKIRFTI